jgi:RNA polymerase sigma factor (sigma-70 family)
MQLKAIGMNFTQMVETEISALRRHARTVTRDSDIADDIVQDTLVRALRFAHLFQGDNIRSWLHTILINLNRNRLRSLARRPPFSSIDENDASDLAGPEGGGRDIERAIGALTKDQRDALLLVVLEGLSYREIAKLQGVPMGTVASRLARARDQIKAYLDGEFTSAAPSAPRACQPTPASGSSDPDRRLRSHPGRIHARPVESSCSAGTRRAGSRARAMS